MSEIDDYFKKINGGKTETTSNSKTASVVDDYFKGLEKQKPTDIAPTKPVVAPKQSIFSKVSEFIAGSAQDPIYNTGSKMEILKNLPNEIVRTILPGAAALNDNPELAYEVSNKDLIKEVPGAVFETVVAPAASYPLTFAGVGNTLMGKSPEISFEVPGLGKVTNLQARIAQQYSTGDVPKTKLGTGAVVALNAGVELLNGLFLASMVKIPFSPRPQAITPKSKSPVTIPKNEGTFQAPKTGQLYEQPTFTKPIDPVTFKKITTENNIPVRTTYNPKNPTFFRATNFTDENKAIGQFFQVKPSYYDTMIDFIKKGKTTSVPDIQIIPVSHVVKTTSPKLPIKSLDGRMQVSTPPVEVIPFSPNGVIPKGTDITLSDIVKTPVISHDKIAQSTPQQIMDRNGLLYEQFETNIETPLKSEIAQLEEERKSLTGKDTKAKKQELQKKIEELKEKINSARNVVENEQLDFQVSITNEVMKVLDEAGVDIGKAKTRFDTIDDFGNMSEEISNFNDEVQQRILEDRVIESAGTFNVKVKDIVKDFLENSEEGQALLKGAKKKPTKIQERNKKVEDHNKKVGNKGDIFKDETPDDKQRKANAQLGQDIFKSKELKEESFTIKTDKGEVVAEFEPFFATPQVENFFAGVHFVKLNGDSISETGFRSIQLDGTDVKNMAEVKNAIEELIKIEQDKVSTPKKKSLSKEILKPKQEKEVKKPSTEPQKEVKKPIVKSNIQVEKEVLKPKAFDMEAFVKEGNDKFKKRITMSKKQLDKITGKKEPYKSLSELILKPSAKKDVRVTEVTEKPIVPLVTKTDVASLLKNNLEFQENPVLVVEAEVGYNGTTVPAVGSEVQIDSKGTKYKVVETFENGAGGISVTLKNPMSGREFSVPLRDIEQQVKYLSFKGDKSEFKIKASALGLKEENLNVGDEITVDPESLKVAGSEKQMRVYKGGNVMASLASPQGKKTLRKIFERQSTAKPTEVQETPKDFKISERAKDILKEFGIVSGERELSNRYLGLYKPLVKKIRVQSYYDITTVTHEAVHGIDDQIGFSKKIIADPDGRKRNGVRKQLTDIYEALYPNAKRTHKLDTRIKEGLAVLFENYFYDPVNTAQAYPELVEAFIKPSGKYYDPLFAKLLDRMNTLVEDYSKLSPEDRIASRIRTGKEIVDKQTGFSLSQRIVFEVFNRFEPLKRYAKDAGVSETWDDPMVQAFNILNKNSIVYNWVKGHETPILMRDGNFKIEKGSVADYLALVKGNEKEWRSYLVARRVHEASNNVTALKNARDEVIANAEPNPDLVDIFMTDKVVIETNGTETSKPGLSREQAEKKALQKQREVIANQFNEKIQKIQKIIEADDFSTQDANAVVQKYSEKFAEAEKIYDDINKRLIDLAEQNDLIDADTANTYRTEKGYASFRRFIDDELDSLGTIKTSSKSKVSSFKERTGSQLDIVDPVYSQILAINEVMGKAMENRLWNKVDGLIKRNPEIAQRFEPLEPQTAVAPDGTVSFPQEKDPNIIRIFVKGKRQFRKASPEFLAIAKTLRGKEFDAFVQLLRIPSSVFTRLTTSANPLFAVGNMTVDQFSATTQTKSGYKPIIDPAKGLYDYVTGDEGLKAYYAVGGKKQTLSAYFDLSPDEIVHSLTGGETKVEKVSGYIDSALGVLEWPSNLSEILTRFGEYKRSVASGEPMSVAMYRASEVTTPFQLSGNFGGRLGQEYIKSIPYLNAIIQVLYKFGRTVKDDPKRVSGMLAGLLALGLTTAVLTMKKSSEKQKRLLSEQPTRNMSRYIYFPSPNGEDLIKIRIPEQFGVFTGMAYLYVIQHYGGNKATFDDYGDVVASAIPEQINFFQPKKQVLSFLPQVLKPSVSVSANTKTFPEVAPIVPAFVVDRKPSEQYNAYTSKVAKTVGQLTNSSPMLIDYWVKNQFGVVGALFTGKLPTDPINIQEKDFVMSGRSYNRFYDNRELIKQKYTEITGDPKKYGMESVVEIKAENKAYNEISDMLSDMRKINNTLELPEEIRSGMYELLVGLDGENAKEQYSKILPLKAQINAYKNANQIK